MLKTTSPLSAVLAALWADDDLHSKHAIWGRV
jgi:hypothetical protein